MKKVHILILIILPLLSFLFSLQGELDEIARLSQKRVQLPERSDSSLRIEGKRFSLFPFELSGSISKESSIFLLPPFPNQISESCPSLLPLIEFVLPLELFVFNVLALQLFPLLFRELTLEFCVSFFFLLSLKRSLGIYYIF